MKKKTQTTADTKEHIMKKAGSPLWQWTPSLVVLTVSSQTLQVWYHRDTTAKTESRLAYFKYAFLSLQGLPSQTLNPQEEGEDENVPTKMIELWNSTFFSPWPMQNVVLLQ